MIRQRGQPRKSPARDTTSPIFCSACRSRHRCSSARQLPLSRQFLGSVRQDEWKLRGNLTLNLGVRYEYVSPFSEENNRIANLDLSPAVLNPATGHAGRGCGSARANGPYSGNFPDPWSVPTAIILLHASASRGSHCRKPWCAADTASTTTPAPIRASCSIWPFSRRFRPRRPTSKPRPGALTLQNGFPAVPPAGITNNFGVNPNYRLGYVQIRNLDIQQQIRPTLIAEP